MSDFIDEHLIVNIVSRLPVESVLQCRCVCKRWRDLLHELYFTQIHTDRTLQQQQQQQIVSFFILVNIPNTNNYEFHLQDYYVDDVDVDDDDNVVSSSSHHSKVISRPLNPPPQLLVIDDDDDDQGKGDSFVKWSIAGSINGLICLYGYSSTPDYYNNATPIFIIYNPITREYLNVPSNDESLCIKDGRNHMATGFGYNPKTNEYKIVTIIHQGTNDRYGYIRWIQIYTLGSGGGGGDGGKWRITKEEGKTRHYFKSTGLPFNGAIYWLAAGKAIVSFDMEDEKLRNIPTPPMDYDLHYELRVLRECLCVIEESTNIWVMNNNNNTTEYSKFSMPDMLMWASVSFQYKLIAVTWKGRVLCLYNKRSLVYFDPKTENRESLGDIPLFEGSAHMAPYTKSLVSLKALGEEDAKIIEQQRVTEKKRTDTTKRRKRRSIDMKTQLIKLFTSLVLNVYLGMPRQSTKLSYVACTPLINKVTVWIQSSKIRFLSYVGRMLLINVVLNMFWGACFDLPKYFYKEINSIYRRFLWAGMNLSIYKERIFHPFNEGGLPITNLRIAGDAATFRHMWPLLSNKETHWVSWVNRNLIRDKDFWL